MKELRLLIRVKNNRLLERRESLKLSQPAMAQVIGMPSPNFMALENLRRSPVARGAWTRDALKIAEYFDCDPEELFPDAILAIQEPAAERRVDAAEIAQLGLSSHTEQLLLPPDEKVANRQTLQKTREVLATLRPQEKTLLTKYYGLDDEGGMTIRQITESDPIYPSINRVLQVIQSGIGRMRRNYDYIEGKTSHMRDLPTETSIPPVSAAKFTRVVDLARDWPGTEGAIKRAVREICATWPRQARVIVTINTHCARKLNLFVILPTTSASNLTDASWWIQQATNVELSNDQPIKVHVKKHDYPTTSRKKIDRLAEDARAGGFEILEVGRRKIVLALRDEDPREEILKMKLWFCDRARAAKLEAKQIAWSLPPRKGSR